MTVTSFAVISTMEIMARQGTSAMNSAVNIAM
jgi:hypothetical protein